MFDLNITPADEVLLATNSFHGREATKLDKARRDNIIIFNRVKLVNF